MPPQPPTSTRLNPITPPESDPFMYGWREITTELADGTVRNERFPLTLEDILHPQVGDFRVHTSDHERFCAYLYVVFKALIAKIKGAIVLHDVRVDWGVDDIRPHGPDIAVIFDVAKQKDWSTFRSQDEGTKPSIVVEITSPKTRNVDLVDKFDEYQDAGLPLYFIVDNYKRRGKKLRRLLGYELTEDGYKQLPSNANGQLWIAPLKVWLGLEGLELYCYDQLGERIGDYTEINQQLAAAMQRAEDAESRAKDAESRVATAESRAEQELQARLDAEEKLAQMQAELERLRRQADSG